MCHTHLSNHMFMWSFCLSPEFPLWLSITGCHGLWLNIRIFPQPFFPLGYLIFNIWPHGLKGISRTDGILCQKHHYLDWFLACYFVFSIPGYFYSVLFLNYLLLLLSWLRFSFFSFYWLGSYKVYSCQWFFP